METKLAIRYLELELKRNIQARSYEDFVTNLRSLVSIDPRLARSLAETELGISPSTRALLDYFTARLHG